MEIFDLSKVRGGFTSADKGVGFADNNAALNLTTDSCKWGYQPTWSDDAPVISPTTKPSVEEPPVVQPPLQNVSELTVPPQKQNDMLLKSVLLGVGVFVLLKLIE